MLTFTELEGLAAEVGARLLACGWRLATAESCTGGLIGGVATAIPGSSAWFECGFITYSNASKQTLLAVPEALLLAHGAVSEPVVRAMAEGALQHSAADIAVAVSGIAGPEGGSAAKPVGTVCLAWAMRTGITQAVTQHFSGDRQAVRLATIEAALQGVLARAPRP